MREVLAPHLEAGQIVLMDNLSLCAQTSKWVRDLIEEKGCQSCGSFRATRPT
jgi:hypothetical protein